MWTRILMSCKNFNDSQKDSPCTVSRIITQNEQMQNVQMSRGADVWIFCEPLFFFFLFGSKSSWLYTIPDTDANSRGYTSCLPATHCMWTRLLLACYPRNLRGIFTKNTSVPFTLGTRYTSCSAAASTNVKGLFKSITKRERERERGVYWSRRISQFTLTLSLG